MQNMCHYKQQKYQFWTILITFCIFKVQISLAMWISHAIYVTSVPFYDIAASGLCGIWVIFCLNSLRPRQNGRYFADDTFKRIFLNENIRISIKISQKFVPKGPINNNPTLVQIMAWRRSGDKPLSELVLVILPTHICVARLQWVNIGHQRHR